jgi:diadenosine tetraphosphate (Ap4A) HIT family hydrolase
VTSAPCDLCVLAARLDARGELHRVGTDWFLNRYQGDGTRPRFVLQAQRHVTGLEKLDANELGSLGRTLGRAIGVIKREPGVERVYVISYNETAPGHTHLHLVPRFTGESDVGPQLSDDVAAPGFDVSRVLKRVAPLHSVKALDSPLVMGSRALLGFWNRRLSAYVPLRRLAKRYPRMLSDAGESYVGFWLGLLWAGVLGDVLSGLTSGEAHPSPWVAAPLAVLAFYRLIDMAVYILNILLTTYQSSLISVARSLLLFLLNLVELTAIGYLLLIASDVPLADAFPLALSLTTSLGGVDQALPPLAIASVVAVNVVTLAIFALGVAMLVGKIGDSFTDLSVSPTRTIPQGPSAPQSQSSEH